MAIEAIKEIRKVEMQADEMIKESHEQSKKIISDATIEGDKRYNEIITEAKNVAKEIMNNAEDAGKKEAEIILSEGKGKCAEVSNLTGDKINDAVNLIIERIVKTNGNS
ncbi:V-type ATP synthase subunit H [Clostridium sp.]|uniref:V-type ATP synthase subunit H n=1 Tax=Clostridium sp. TaxID=1506 RepID=UPI002607E95F|nr:V-type ATP synthase subunit H [Clostridium sp.]